MTMFNMFKGLSSLLLLTIIVFTSHCMASTASRSTSFSRLILDKERLSSQYKSLEETSGLQCSAVCAKEEECRAFNHNAGTGSCELIHWSANEKQVAEDSSWTVYEKVTRNPVRYTIPTASCLINNNYLEDAGGWKSMSRCPNGSFATAYAMQRKPYDPGNGLAPHPDNTALTGLQLTCSDQHGNVTATVTSGQASCEPGVWGVTTECTTSGHYLTSLKVQNDNTGVPISGSAGLDQTALNHITFRCRDLEATVPEYAISAPPGTGHAGVWGNWTNSCPPKEAVCITQTKIKDNAPDCYGLVDVRLCCCKAIYN